MSECGDIAKANQGVNIKAEVELLSAIVIFFKQLEITSSDVGIKVSSRKMGKIPLEEIEKELVKVGNLQMLLEEFFRLCHCHCLNLKNCLPITLELYLRDLTEIENSFDRDGKLRAVCGVAEGKKIDPSAYSGN
ncbi:hypothetical protein SUGI_0853860 [Cryptomeria japonica]|nr:hypothetical protein SUGI_0853860 [Cryptomeria japonica]